ncbi:MAG TPA: M28 family metallopeptidase [Gemmatimonadales bacterium]|nr:M28 family metallopeptidase [Gemmatimonadales bacterium]
MAAALALALVSAPLAAQSIADTYRPTAQRIIEQAQSDSSAWNTLAELTDRFGHRLSGSESLERAIDWILAEMKEEGFDAVRGEPVMVPHWVRGNESLELVAPRPAHLPMLGLGMSVGTPPGGITGDVIVVSSFQELEARSSELQGKIVLYDAPFTGYGETVAYRTEGASRAAKHGAVAALVRSIASGSMRSPHTGTMTYDSTVARIPAAAITVEDAMMLHRMQERGSPIRVTLKMEAKTLPDTRSRNVVAEIRGSERPDEVVVLGGHIDSWDVGQGAMDDGGGCVAAWEALRLIRELGLRPRRTIRVVFWTNEENGTRGGTGYVDAHRDQVDQHILALESDNGAFRPRGFGFTGSDAALAIITEIGSLLEPIGADSVSKGGGGADIGPLMREGVPGMSPRVDGERYFWYHHSRADTMDKLDPAHMQQLAAAMAVMVYTVADLPEPLPR